MFVSLLKKKGTLRIVGDANDKGGDISLRLEANETSVVAIDRTSKNLTLVKPLDKEVRAEPSNYPSHGVSYQFSRFFMVNRALPALLR